MSKKEFEFKLDVVYNVSKKVEGSTVHSIELFSKQNLDMLKKNSCSKIVTLSLNEVYATEPSHRKGHNYFYLNETL